MKIITGSFALVCVSALVLVAATACSSSDNGQPEATGYLGDPIAEPWDKPDIRLIDENNRPFDLRDETEGYVTAIYFGYTHCPDICPTHMADLSYALQDNPALAERVKVVFVTVDPERDDSRRLKAWLDLFDEEFIGLTGTEEEIAAAGEAAFDGLWRAIKRFETHGDDYTVSHPAFVVGFGLDNKAHVIWQLGTPTETYANDIALMIEEGSS